MAMKVMIKVYENETLRSWYFKGFKDIDEIIRYCTSKTNGKYLYDFEVVR